MTPEYVGVDGLQVARPLFDLVRDEIAPGTGVDPDSFWRSLGEIVNKLEPGNRKLLEKRDRLQKEIDACIKREAANPSTTKNINPSSLKLAI